MNSIKLPFIPERTARPRNHGVTMVMDKGLGLRETEHFIEGNVSFVDIVKFGFGTALVTEKLDEKLKMYREAGITPYFGGTLFEVFYARGMADQYFKFLDKHKMEMMEISDGSIIIPHDEKCELIAKASKNFKVLSEVGSKDSGIIVTPARWIKSMKNELEAGSWKVIAEGRESGNVGVFRPNGTAHTLLINRIIKNVSPEDIMWEAPQKSQQVWFIKLFGANVNLGNIAPNEVIPLECLRLGLRGDTFFDNLPKETADRLKHVNEEGVEEDSENEE
jgi:phosphosulfolactate synthase